jgi:hypothetical protein
VLVDIHLDVEFFESFGCFFPKFEKAILAGKPIGLQQNFVLAVVNHVVGEMPGFRMFAYVLVHEGTILQRLARGFTVERIWGRRLTQLYLKSRISR